MKTILLGGLFLLVTGIAHGAEVFVRVLKTGTHYATVYNQTQYNSTNIFRFFDLPGGTISVQIVEQTTGNFVYNGSIYLNSNQRIVAELDNQGHLNILQNTTVEYVNWYTPAGVGTTVVYPNGNGTYYPNNGGGVQNPNSGVDQQSFNLFLGSLDKENFDSKKLERSKRYIDKGSLTSQQIKEITMKFSFDSNRLDWAKYAYTKCSDKQNYFILKEAFSFQSSYSDLEEYMATH